jgi:hypothetical protein
VTERSRAAANPRSLDAPAALFENSLMRKLICVFAIALGAAPAAAGPRDPLYTWTDAAGAVRYTTERDRIPAERREEAAVVAAGHEPQPAAASEEPSSAAPPVDAAPPASPSPEVAALDARIAELEQLIAADEAALGDYISDPERIEQGASSEVAAIAERLPKLQNELRELRRQREAAASAAPNVSP